MDIFQKEVAVLDNQAIYQIGLTNDNGVTIHLLTLGATLQAFLVPSQSGQKNIVLGHDNPLDYLTDPLCAGQTIGRVAGRIKGGEFSIDDQVYTVDKNEKGNCLHGGFHGFHQLNWDYETQQGDDEVVVVFRRKILASEDHFPNDLQVAVSYRLDNANRLSIEFEATALGGDSLFNPTNHVYFNLGQSQDLEKHTLHIQSSQYLATHDDLIPTGETVAVADTVYDFRMSKPLYPAIVENHGFDTAFVIDDEAIGTELPIAVLQDRDSQDQISIYSDRNALVIYTMDSIPQGLYFGRDGGKEGQAREGIAMEAQTLPDAVNHNGFGDIVIRENEQQHYHISFVYEPGIIEQESQ